MVESSDRDHTPFSLSFSPPPLVPSHHPTIPSTATTARPVVPEPVVRQTLGYLPTVTMSHRSRGTASGQPGTAKKGSRKEGRKTKMRENWPLCRLSSSARVHSARVSLPWTWQHKLVSWVFVMYSTCSETAFCTVLAVLDQPVPGPNDLRLAPSNYPCKEISQIS